MGLRITPLAIAPFAWRSSTVIRRQFRLSANAMYNESYNASWLLKPIWKARGKRWRVGMMWMDNPFSRQYTMRYGLKKLRCSPCHHHLLLLSMSRGVMPRTGDLGSTPLGKRTTDEQLLPNLPSCSRIVECNVSDDSRSQDSFPALVDI